MDQKEIFLILDTNTYLHYLTFTDIDWCRIFSSKNICLVVPTVILDELDHHKNDHKFSHLRKRAQKITNLLEAFMDDPAKSPRKGVRIDFFDESDEIVNAGISHNDTRLILAAKELINEGNDNVILVTHDVGLTLRAKRRGLTTRKLPEDYKIEIIDETGKKNRELERKVSKLEQGFPKLSLRFEKDTIKTQYTLPPPAAFPDLIDHMSFIPIKQEYDKKIEICQNTLYQKQSADLLNQDLLTDEQTHNKTRRISRRRKNEINQQLDQLNQQLREVSPMELTRFINEANSFMQYYWSYLQQKKQWQNQRNLIIELKLVIKNDGSIPAQDTEIDIELPENATCSFIRPDQFPEQPLPPNPPEEPRLNGVIFGEAIAGIWGWLFKKKSFSVSPMSPVRQLVSHNQLEENAIKIRQNEKVTKISIRKAKHTQSILLPSLYLRFNDHGSAQSFNFNYRILADNTPEPADGNLHVVINKPPIILPMFLPGNI